MIHLLYGYARRTGDGSSRVLTEDELKAAGVHCDPDSRQVRGWAFAAMGSLSHAAVIDRNHDLTGKVVLCDGRVGPR